MEQDPKDLLNFGLAKLNLRMQEVKAQLETETNPRNRMWLELVDNQLRIQKILGELAMIIADMRSEQKTMAQSSAKVINDMDVRLSFGKTA